MNRSFIRKKRTGSCRRFLFSLLLALSLSCSLPQTASAASTSLVLNHTTLRLPAGSMFQMYAYVTPRRSVSWRCSNQVVASIDSYGMLRAKKRGAVIVYATSGGITRTCSVTVYNPT